jgi:Leucine-rich repeat (LRR) protein
MYNRLEQLPASLSSLLRLQSLLAGHNLLTELPPLPDSLSRIDVSYNRLKGLDAHHLLRLTFLTSLCVARAFSHPPRSEGGPVVGALARVAAMRGGGVVLRCDRDVAELVRTRARLIGGTTTWLRVIAES